MKKRTSNIIVDVGHPSHKRRKVIRLRPYNYAEKLERIWRPLSTLARGITVTILFFMLIIGRSLLVSADVAYFYSESCLGDWQNPSLASGPRESDQEDVDELTEENSSILHEGKGRIYCGSFTGSLPEGAMPTGVTVNLAFAIKDAIKVEVNEGALIEDGVLDANYVATSTESSTSTPSAENAQSSETTRDENVESGVETKPKSETQIKPDATSAESSESESVKNNEVIEESSVEKEIEPVAEPETQPEAVKEPEPVQETEPEPLSWFYLGAQVALAQEEDIDLAPEPAPSSEVQVEPEVSVSTPETVLDNAEAQSEPEKLELQDTEVKIEESIEENVEESIEENVEENVNEAVADSGVQNPEVLGEATSTEETIVVGQVADPNSPERVAEIMYTIDGENWISIGEINVGDSGDAVFSVPIASLDDVARMQISVQGLGSGQALPEIFLDSIWAEVSYELEAEEVEAEPGREKRPSYTSMDFTVGLVDELKDVYAGTDPSVRCQVTPFAQEVEFGKSADLNFRVNLPSDPGAPFRVRFGDLPIGLSLTNVSEVKDSILFAGERALDFSLHVDVNSPPGQFAVVLMYDTRELLDSRAKTAECAFSINIK